MKIPSEEFWFRIGVCFSLATKLKEGYVINRSGEDIRALYDHLYPIALEAYNNEEDHESETNTSD